MHQDGAFGVMPAHIYFPLLLDLELAFWHAGFLFYDDYA